MAIFHLQQERLLQLFCSSTIFSFTNILSHFGKLNDHLGDVFDEEESPTYTNTVPETGRNFDCSDWMCFRKNDIGLSVKFYASI